MLAITSTHSVKAFFFDHSFVQQLEREPHQPLVSSHHSSLRKEGQLIIVRRNQYHFAGNILWLAREKPAANSEDIDAAFYSLPLYVEERCK